MANARLLEGPGNSLGKLESNLRFRDARIPEGCFLSWQEDYYGPFIMEKPMLLFYKGAQIHIRPSLTRSDGSKTITIRIEVPTGAALEEAIAIALERIGGVVEEINPPLAESFVRGVRNDLRDLKRWVLGTVVAPVLIYIGMTMKNFARNRLDRIESKRQAKQ